MDGFQPYSLDKLGLPKSQCPDKYISFLRDNYSILGARKCAEKLGLSYASIGQYAHRLGITLSSPDRSEITSKFDSTLFTTVRTPEIAYILGFIYADGHVEKSNHTSKRVSFCMITSDFNDIQDSIKKSGNWHIRHTHVQNRKPQTIVRIGNHNLWSFLVENDYHIKSGASADKILSKIPENLKHYWWRGYFDGDGWFSYQKGLKYSFGFSACYDQRWEFVVNLFDQLNIKYFYNQRIRKSGRDSSMNVTNMDGVIKFGSYIYNNYEIDKIGLSRKSQKWSEIYQIFTLKNKNGTI